MTNGLDNIFGVHAQALRLRAKRAELLAANIANADTPNFKARDIDFKAALKDANPKEGIAKTHVGHINPGGSQGKLNLLYRIPVQSNIDGNTVDLHRESAEFSENALHYDASLNFINSRIRSLMSALKGD